MGFNSQSLFLVLCERTHEGLETKPCGRYDVIISEAAWGTMGFTSRFLIISCCSLTCLGCQHLLGMMKTDIKGDLCLGSWRLTWNSGEDPLSAAEILSMEWEAPVRCLTSSPPLAVHIPLTSVEKISVQSQLTDFLQHTQQCLYLCFFVQNAFRQW